MKILLVKLSSLGDVVHTLPVVQDILAARPDARIDWVVERGFAPLLRTVAGIDRVIECELRRWRKQPLSATTRAAWGAFRRELQRETYDAVIDLQGLTKSALVAWLARTTDAGLRYAMANRTEGSGYEAPTRWVADVAVPVAWHSHAVQRGRELCAAVLGHTPLAQCHFGLAMPAGRAWAATKSVAFIHGTSRADKLWPEDHWTALGRRLIAAGYQIGLPHGSDEEKDRSERLAQALGPQAEVWPRLALDALTTRLAACAGAIGVDSGLSHIAVALDLPHVQIYNFDTAWRTGPLPQAPGQMPRQCSVYAPQAPSVDTVWQAWRQVSVPLTAGDA